MKLTTEKNAFRINGFFVLLALFLIDAYALYKLIDNPDKPLISIIIFILSSFLISGFYIVQPNEAKVLNFFGKYTGTIRDDGFWWSNPFSSKKRISLRVRNFDSAQLKVNDENGNPIEIASVIVWKVVNTASALYDVEDYEAYVSIQSETAIRSLASHYPYDTDSKTEFSLRGNPNEVEETLKKELEERLRHSGVTVLEARLSHLAYSPEIAQTMLRRQQAQAIISARQKIVEGAVGMVDMALRMLSEQKIVELDDERKATMVNNLLVTLVSENDTKQVINTGSIY